MTTPSRILKTLAATALAAASLGAAAVPTLQFSAAPASVTIGASFTLLLQGSGFDATAGGSLIDNISGGQKLDLGFGAGLLELVSVTLDPRWTFAAANKTGTVDNAAGTVKGIGFGSFPATTDDSFNIASFNFRAIAAGLYPVQTYLYVKPGRVAGVAGQVVATGLPSASITVSPVPEASSWALFALGLAGIAALGRRRLARD